MAKLKELAVVIRSKNSGPYGITFDVMFPDKRSYLPYGTLTVLCRAFL